ncbi:MAG: pyruvate, phosphate dikinase [Actinomycetota bacterium]|nr:pyruvate, phosphate dikinase [Actinomycetota bacterium]
MKVSTSLESAAPSATPRRYVYDFDEGDRSAKDLLGGKGANLAEMTKLGLPVPPGFTITTEACREYMAASRFPDGLMDEVAAHLRRLEEKMGKRLGDPDNPLLVSVRSGAKFSMPGMMDTVLNLGINDRSLEGLAKQSGNLRFAYDVYRRFIQMFGKIVMGVSGERFEEAIEEAKHRTGVTQDTELGTEDLKELVARFKQIVHDATGATFPEDPLEQLKLAIEAVFRSWSGERARIYRRQNKISDSLGTGVNVQAIVFGNMGDDSGTGVAFTRDAATGARSYLAEYLPNAQGEDVVSGSRTPMPLEALKESDPESYEELTSIMSKLENHYRDMCDIEFTVERGKLWMLQTRIGKRTAAAAVKIAVDLQREGLITQQEAVLRIDPASLDQLLHPQFDPSAPIDVIAKGLNASPGAAVGKAVFDAKTAEQWAARGEKVILVRPMTEPDDVGGMYASQGILTSRGGKTSHAAVVARGAGKPCVCGAEALKIDLDGRRFSVGDIVVGEGDVIAINGTTGEVALGDVPLVEPELSEDLATVLSWADAIRRLRVRANADTPEDARKAREFGAEGIGLARTEHMFLGDRLPIVQRMIMAETPEQEKEALDELLHVQRADFAGIFTAMSRLPVTIRLLDPPLHEFLPSSKELELQIQSLEIFATASAITQSASHHFHWEQRDVPVDAGQPRSMQLVSEDIAAKKALLASVVRLEESNPMLGMRGVRLGIVKPGLYTMQVRAIIEAACDVKEKGVDPVIEIMIPLVAVREELEMMRREAEAIIEEVLTARGVEIDYLLGTMIELPRAALVAGELAEAGEFFSFGTNDLTQTAFGFSRDDIEGKFLPKYLDQGILKTNPFESLDRPGVGRLIEIAVKEGRAARPDLKVGICGEHGGDPSSVEFCHQAGLDYVSCSPFRVPVARLAAAQAVLKESDVKGSDAR